MNLLVGCAMGCDVIVGSHNNLWESLHTMPFHLCVNRGGARVWTMLHTFHQCVVSQCRECT